MKTTFKGQDLYIGFKYTNTVLNQWLEVAGISKEGASKMKRAELKARLSKIMKLVKARDIPTADLTHCILLDAEQKVLCDVSVVLRPGENHSRPKARIYALQKALKTVFDGEEFKELRTSVWKSYHNRANHKRVVAVH